MVEAILDSLVRADGDRQLAALIVTGAGSAFSSGGNLQNLHEMAQDSPLAIRSNYRRGIQRLPLAFEAIEVPVIAAVNGPAIGAGCDLACMCDIRIAAESAVFAESFVKLGLIPGDGGAWLLPRVVGFAKASEMALTGARVSASEALACGLVTKVVPDRELMAAALDMANSIAENPVHAVRMTKRLLREAAQSRLDTVLELSAAMQSLAHQTPEHRDALAKLVEKIGSS
ncbi:MAG: enoyl-CoA hydratase-related protein [Parahaliea sp.]